MELREGQGNTVIHHDVKQGSPEWLKLRAGLPTSSRFDKIITKAGKPTDSKGRRTFISQLLAERMLGHALKEVTSAAMGHGSDFEAEAVASVCFERGIDTEVCGLFTDDAQTFGASPDRLIRVGDAMEGLEIKCPMKPEIHVSHLLYPDEFEKEHRPQVQGQVHVVGFQRVHLVSYYRNMPLLIVPCEPKMEFQKTLGEALNKFCGELAALVDKARAEGWIQEREPEPEPAEWLTAADAEAVIAARFPQEGGTAVSK